MAAPMQFWGVEVKAKEPCKVSLEDGYVIHVSQATLGDIKKDNEPVIVHVKAGEKKLVMGILSQKTPQLSFDLVFDTDFEISHNWKNGSIHLMGYETEFGGSDTEFGSYDEDEEPIPILRENGGPAAVAAKAPSKAGNMPKHDEDDSDDDDSSDDGEDEDSEDGADDQEMETASSEDSEDEDDDEDDSHSEDDTTPVKIDASKKRPNADAKTPQSKKAKIATPQKTDGKKGSIVHPATPHPVKGKTPKSGDKTPKSGEKTPKSGGSEVSCGSCKKTFKSDVALQSHSKAKHGAK